MKLAQQVAGLSQRVDGLSLRVDGLGERIDSLDQRVDRFEARVEERFEAIDKRFDTVDRRFDRLEVSVDVRFDDMKRHSDVIAEASRDDFRNLYDLVQAHMERVDARTGTLAVSLRAEMKLGYDALDSRVTLIEQNDQPGRRRPRR